MSDSLRPHGPLPGSSVHGIFQARVLEWVAISFSRGSSQPRDRTQVSCTAGRCFTEESEKVGFKLNIQKTKVMASGPITSWEIDGETVSDFIFLGSKITADGDCSHEIKRCLLLEKKVMTNLDSILKSRDVILPKKICLVKAIGEGNGNPLQYSCLANPMDGGAW